MNTRMILLLALLAGAIQCADAQKVKIIGHRGAATLTPENTMVGFRKAIDLGVDYLEMDVWYTLDDSLVIIHDATLDRTTDLTGAVTSQTYAYIRTADAGSWFSSKFAGEPIPTLREVLTLIKQRNFKAAIEIKATNLTTLLDTMIQDMGLVNNVTVASFFLNALDVTKKYNPNFKILYYVNTITTKAIDDLKAIGGHIISPGGGHTQAMVNYAHLNGLEYWPWTIDDTTWMRTYMNMGVDGIITNYPQWLLAMRDSSLVSVSEERGAAPLRFGLSENYPNPFNPTTTIGYTVGGVRDQASGVRDVKLRVYDLLGREVATLVDETKAPGAYRVTFDARGLASGVYIARLHSGGRTDALKMVLAK